MSLSDIGYYPNVDEPILPGARFSFAQNWEDAYLHRVLGELKDGFYVDVGAWHPTRDSVTRLFYDLGWTGINLEPGDMFEALEAARPRDVNLPIAIAAVAGKRAFLDLTDVDGSPAGTSHLDFGGETSVSDPSASRRSVETRPLSDVLSEHASDREIHFMKIDVEGAEREVLLSNDWTRFRPWILVVEATLPGSPEMTHHVWEEILTDAGYMRAFFDGLNMYYVRDDKADFVPLLNRPINVFDQFRRFEPSVAETHVILGELDQALSESEGHLADARDALSVAEQERNTLAAERAGLEATVLHLRAELSAAISTREEAERVRGIEETRAMRLGVSAARLRRLQDRYRLDGATRELRFGLWIARRLRQLDRAVARLAFRKRLFLRPMKERFLIDPITGESNDGALLSVEFLSLINEIRMAEARLRDRELRLSEYGLAMRADIEAIEVRASERERLTAEALQGLLMTVAVRSTNP